MIREIPEKEWRLTDLHQLNFEWDNRWVVFWTPKRGLDRDGTGYVVAYGDGSHADRDALRRKYVLDKYRGKAMVRYGHKPGEVITCGIQQG